MGGAIAKTFVGGHGSVKRASTKVRGMRNRRRAAWAKEAFYAKLEAERMAERMETRNNRFDDYEEDGGYQSQSR